MKPSSPKFKRCLLEELPRLEEAGLLPADVRAKLDAHYRQDLPPETNRLVMAMGTLAALLIGSGIILIFAHNWAHLARPLRAVLALAPLLITATLSFWVLRRGHDNWREATGLAQALAVGTAISLIGQTYHMPSSNTGFFLSWALLILPLIFLLRSHAVHLVYLGLVVTWGFAARGNDEGNLLLWGLLLPAIAWTLLGVRDRAQSHGTLLALWALAIALSLSVLAGLQNEFVGLTLAVMVALHGCFFLLGQRLAPTACGWSNPLSSAGLLTLTFLGYLFSWSDFWGEVAREHIFRATNPTVPAAELIILIGLMAGWGLLTASVVGRRPRPNPVVIGLPLLLVTLVLGVMSGAVPDIVAALFTNFALLAMAVIAIWQGFQHLRLSTANYGLALASALVITRFFDAEFSFLARGLGFIAVGIGFLVANLKLARRKRAQQEDSS